MRRTNMAWQVASVKQGKEPNCSKAVSLRATGCSSQATGGAFAVLAHTEDLTGAQCIEALYVTGHKFVQKCLVPGGKALRACSV